MHSEEQQLPPIPDFVNAQPLFTEFNVTIKVLLNCNNAAEKFEEIEILQNMLQPYGDEVTIQLTHGPQDVADIWKRFHSRLVEENNDSR